MLLQQTAVSFAADADDVEAHSEVASRYSKEEDPPLASYPIPKNVTSLTDTEPLCHRASPEHSNEALDDTSQGTELDVLDENAIPAISLDELDITAFRENIADGKWFIKFYAPVGADQPTYHPVPPSPKPSAPAIACLPAHPLIPLSAKLLVAVYNGPPSWA